MAEGVELALGAMIFLGLADLAYQRGAAAGVRPHHFLLGQAWCFAPGVFAYGLATGTLAIGPAFAWGMGAGLFAFIAQFHFARALEAGPVSVVAPVFRLSFTVTVALAVVALGEPLTGWKVAGFVLALAAVWLLFGARGGPSVSPAPRQAVVLALIAMAALGVANFLYKVGALTGAAPASFIAGQASVFLPLATAFSWMTDKAIRAPRPLWPPASAAAFSFLVALVLLFSSLERGEASVLVPITQMGFVVTAIFGVLVLKEPLRPRKSAGLACALAALAALARG
jgi:drug/metabolite transporter (DMT)-like permease